MRFGRYIVGLPESDLDRCSPDPSTETLTVDAVKSKDANENGNGTGISAADAIDFVDSLFP